MMNQKKKYSLKEFFDFREVFEYYFRGGKKRGKPDFNLRIMHGINKISIILFIIAIILLTIRFIIRQ
jgi:hypothetical protein